MRCWRLLCIMALAGRAQSAVTNPEFFAKKLYPVLEQAQCRICHSPDGGASATRLHFPEKGAQAQQIQLFGLSLAPLVDRADPAKSLLRNKPTNRIRHTGGERVKPGSEEESIL